jgi:hypothetical protein
MGERSVSPLFFITIDLKSVGHFPCGDLEACGDGGGGGGGDSQSLKKTLSHLLLMKTSDFI